MKIDPEYRQALERSSELNSKELLSCGVGENPVLGCELLIRRAKSTALLFFQKPDILNEPEIKLAMRQVYNRGVKIMVITGAGGFDVGDMGLCKNITETMNFSFRGFVSVDREGWMSLHGDDNYLCFNDESTAGHITDIFYKMWDYSGYFSS